MHCNDAHYRTGLTGSTWRHDRGAFMRAKDPLAKFEGLQQIGINRFCGRD